MNRGGLVLSTSFSVGHERARARKKKEQATNARGLQTARRISCFGHSLGVGVRYCNLIYRACVCVCAWRPHPDERMEPHPRCGCV